LLCDCNDVDGDGVEAEALEEVLCLNIDVELSALVLGNIEGRDFGDVLILAFSLLFLELEGDTTDGTTLNTLHQMGCVSSDLVAETLRGNNGNLIADSLVGLEVESQLWVVSLDDDLCGLLDGLGTNATHDCGFGGGLSKVECR